MNLVVSLFDKTGRMVEPWVENGRMALIVDIQHPCGLRQQSEHVWTLGCDLRSGFTIPDGLPDYDRVEFTAAFPPCDHLAVSGARWFKGKGLRALALSIDLFATAAEACELLGAPYQIENPVSTISTYWRAPDHTFHPWQYAGHEPADNYTKKTCLWTGHGFAMPDTCEDLFAGAPDDRIHKMPPSKDRADLRSATPRGWAKAVFLANREEARQDRMAAL